MVIMVGLCCSDAVGSQLGVGIGGVLDCGHDIAGRSLEERRKPVKVQASLAELMGASDVHTCV